MFSLGRCPIAHHKHRYNAQITLGTWSTGNTSLRHWAENSRHLGNLSVTRGWISQSSFGTAESAVYTASVIEMQKY